MYKKIIIMAIILELVLGLLFKNLAVCFLVALMIIMVLALIKKSEINRDKILALDEQCDPDLFLSMNEKMKKWAKFNKEHQLVFTLDEALGLSEKGEYEKALERLQSIPPILLTDKEGTLKTYNIIYLSCLYGLDKKEAFMKKYNEGFEEYLYLDDLYYPYYRLIQSKYLIYCEEYSEAAAVLVKLTKMNMPKRLKYHVHSMLYRVHEHLENDEEMIKHKEICLKGSDKLIVNQLVFE